MIKITVAPKSVVLLGFIVQSYDFKYNSQKLFKDKRLTLFLFQSITNWQKWWKNDKKTTTHKRTNKKTPPRPHNSVCYWLQRKITSSSQMRDWHFTINLKGKRYVFPIFKQITSPLSLWWPPPIPPPWVWPFRSARNTFDFRHHVVRTTSFLV